MYGLQARRTCHCVSAAGNPVRIPETGMPRPWRWFEREIMDVKHYCGTITNFSEEDIERSVRFILRDNGESARGKLAEIECSIKEYFETFNKEHGIKELSVEEKLKAATHHGRQLKKKYMQFKRKMSKRLEKANERVENLIRSVEISEILREKDKERYEALKGIDKAVYASIKILFDASEEQNKLLKQTIEEMKHGKS